MPHLEFFVIAESVSVDQSTNRLSLFNIVEELRQFPVPAGAGAAVAGLNQLVAVSMWNIAEEEREQTFNVTLRVEAPGQPPQDLSTLEFVAQRSRQRVMHVLIGIPLVQPGEIQFSVLLNGEHKASHAITVTRLDRVPAGVQIAGPEVGAIERQN